MKADWKAKFFTDPDWSNVVDMFEEYIRDVDNIRTIDTDRHSEAVHADLIARQLVAERLQNFINSTKLFAKTAQRAGQRLR